MTARAPTSVGTSGATYDVISVSELAPDEAPGARPLAKMDGNYGTAIISASSTTLIKDNPANFAPSDVGKVILVAGGGPAGADLVTMIAAYVSTNTVTLATPASTTVSHDRIVWGTDDAPAWQAAVNIAIARRGGIVTASAPHNPPTPGVSNYTSLIGSEIDMLHWKGGEIIGSSGGAGGGNAAFPMLSYLPATGSLFKFTSVFSVHLKGLTFTFENRGYAGNLIFATSDGSDNSACSISRCGFVPQNTGAGGHPSTLAAWLRLEKVIFSHVDLCSFGEGPAGNAIHLGNVATVGYAVQCSITRSNFSHTLNHIYVDNADTETLLVDGNTFEPTWGGCAGALVGAAGNRVRGQLTYSNNWHGDITVGGRCHIENINAYITGANVFGNFFGTPVDQNGTGFGGATFGKCAGGPWAVWGNHMAGGFALLDNTTSTGADGGKIGAIHFFDNSVLQNNNIVSNGTIKDFGGDSSGWRFDRSNKMVVGSIDPPFTEYGPGSGPVQLLATPNFTLGWLHIFKIFRIAGTPGTLQITVPPESTKYFPIGAEIKFVVPAGYRVQFIAGAGVALSSRSSNKFSLNSDLAECRLLKTDQTDTWWLLGELAAS